MDRNNFIFSPEAEEYIGTFNDFQIQIPEAYMSNERVVFAEAVITMYPRKIVDLAIFCKESETFQACYPEETVNTILNKLHLPILKVDAKGGMFTYCDHEMDDDHLIDIEFTGVMDSFSSVGIDG